MRRTFPNCFHNDLIFSCSCGGPWFGLKEGNEVCRWLLRVPDTIDSFLRKYRAIRRRETSQFKTTGLRQHVPTICEVPPTSKYCHPCSKNVSIFINTGKNKRLTRNSPQHKQETIRTFRSILFGVVRARRFLVDEEQQKFPTGAFFNVNLFPRIDLEAFANQHPLKKRQYLWH